MQKHSTLEKLLHQETFSQSLVYMVATQSHVPLTLNADLRQTTVQLSFSHFKWCLCLAFMLTCISSGTQQLHIIFQWVCALEVCILLKKSDFYFNAAVSSRLDTSPHFLFSSAFIHHTPLDGHKQSCCYGQLRHVIWFVCSSYLSWWRSVQAAVWKEYSKMDVLLSSSSFVLRTRQCLFGSYVPRTQCW